MRLGEIGRGGAVLHGEAIDSAGAGLADNPARTSRHLRHDIGAETLDDLIERAGDRRQRSEPFDQTVTAGDGVAALDRLAVAKHRPRRQIALAVGEGLVELHREGVGEIIQNILARSDVYPDVVPFLRRDLRETALHQGFAGRHDLDHGGMAVD